MNRFTCQKCKEIYSNKFKSCPVCDNISLDNIVLPKTYSMPLKTMFLWTTMIFMLAMLISLQVKILLNTGINIIYLAIMAIESFFLVRMISLIRINLVRITLTETGIIMKKLLPPSKIEIKWKNIKKFRFSSVKSGKGDTKIYVVEDTKTQHIVFNTLFINSLELVEIIKEKAGIKLKKLKGAKGLKVLEKHR